MTTSRRRASLCVSEHTLAALFDVLSRERFRKYIRLDQRIDYVEGYVGISEQVIVTEHVVACCNPRENTFLSLAVSGKADCILVW